MVTDRVRVVVVGAGVIGCSIAYSLVRDGRFHVTVIDRNGTIAGGSTSASTAIIRQYYRHSESVKLARSGLRVWERWCQWLGGILPESSLTTFHQVGVLWCFLEETRAYEAPHIDVLQRLGVTADILDPDEMRHRFPSISVPDEPPCFGLHEPEAGFVEDAIVATQNLMEAACAHDPTMELRLCTKLISVVHDCDDKGTLTVRSIDVQCGSEVTSLPADVLVNAAGPHSYIVNALVKCPIGLTTVPNRQQVLESRETALAWQSDRLPVCIDFVNGLYIKPDKTRFRLGANHPSDEVDFVADPDAVNQGVSPEFANKKRRGLELRIPGARLEDTRAIVGVYDVTAADWKPILDKTEVGGYFVAIGTSGAWFKSAPVIGQAMRDMIVANTMDGKDTDAEPLTVDLPHTGDKLAMSAFGRRRAPHQTGGVVG